MSDFDYESRIVSIPDYPEKGVIFKDITPLFADPEGLVHLVDDIADHFLGRGITKVVGAEARGFLVGAVAHTSWARALSRHASPASFPRGLLPVLLA